MVLSQGETDPASLAKASSSLISARIETAAVPSATVCEPCQGYSMDMTSHAHKHLPRLLKHISHTVFRTPDQQAYDPGLADAGHRPQQSHHALAIPMLIAY